MQLTMDPIQGFYLRRLRPVCIFMVVVCMYVPKYVYMSVPRDA